MTRVDGHSGVLVNSVESRRASPGCSGSWGLREPIAIISPVDLRTRTSVWRVWSGRVSRVTRHLVRALALHLRCFAIARLLLEAAAPGRATALRCNRFVRTQIGLQQADVKRRVRLHPGRQVDAIGVPTPFQDLERTEVSRQ
jgi:hypothetical protein